MEICLLCDIQIPPPLWQKVKVKERKRSHPRLFAIPWIVAHQFPLSMEFSRQDYWSGLPFPTPGDLPNSVIKLASLASHALTDSLSLCHQGSPQVSEVIDISPSNLHSSLCFIQPSVFHDVLCM